MRHLTAVLIKVVMVGAVFYVIFNMIYNYPIWETFALSLLVVGLSYLVGDLGILPMSNNTVATLADVGLCTLKVWLIGPFIMGLNIPFFLAFIAAIVLGVGEWFFHKYMVSSVLPRKEAF